MKKCMLMVCLSVMLISGMVSSVYANPVEAEFFFDGVDLDTGAVEYDRTILVILMGETIEELLRPNRAYLADFSLSVDVSFEWDPAEANLFDLILQDDVKIAVLEDTSFDTVESIMPGEFEFTAEPYSVSIDSDDLVLAWTAEDRSFKLGGFRWSDWTLQFEFEELNIIPEPSTFLLFGLGLVGVVALVRRKKNIAAMLAIVVLASLWSVEIANAQPGSLITIKKEGPGNGTILVGDQECDLACVEMSFPYVDKRAVILKVVPDTNSYFAYWKTANGERLQGTSHVQPDDIVSAVFYAVITPNGGTVSLSDGSASVTFPAGATSQDLYIGITTLDETSIPPANTGFQRVSQVYDFRAITPQEEPVRYFNSDVEVTLRYDPDELKGIDAQSLMMQYYDETLAQWLELPSTVNTANHTVTAITNHFTEFAVFYRHLLTPEKIGIEEYTRYKIGEKLQNNEFEQHEIGEKIVYFYQRRIGEAIVEKEFLNYQFDQETEELLKKKIQWREGLPEQLPVILLTQEEAETRAKLEVAGDVLFSHLYIISPDSDVFPLDPTPDNPCWVVRIAVNEYQAAIIIDAITGAFLGQGIPSPNRGFSLSGPQRNNPCSATWTSWYQNAKNWFNTMGYPTTAVEWPTEATVRNQIQDPATILFYELAHGNSWLFANGCSGGTAYEYTTASEIETWMSSRQAMTFAFIGSCGGMCDTGDNTLSYEFRKGSTQDTVTVGYCGMATAHCNSSCWSHSVIWQDALFTYMSRNMTIKDAFDDALADYPMCAGAPACMRFAGDPDLKVLLPCQVTNNNDSGNGSLRQVLADAESNGCTVITFASGVSTITLNSQLEIPSRLGPLTIDGGGNVTISGNNSTRVFYVGWEADVIFQNLTITHGKASGSGNNAYGGGIYNNCGTVTLGNSATISDNTADDAGGGICNGGSSSSSIYSCGTVIIKNGALVSNNQAKYGGGIDNRYPASTLTIENGARINYNTANREGGGIFNSGTATISGTVSGNSADDGGGIRTNGELIVDGTVSGNTAAWNGGGIWNSDGTVSIWSDGTVSGNAADGDGGGIFNYGNSKPADARIGVWGSVNGNTANRGGGIRNKGGIVIIRGTVRSNQADYGGGIFQSNDGFSTRVQRFEVFGTISSNTARYDGGGIWVEGSNGGPEPNYISSDGKIINNNALNGKGGGIYDYASTILGADSVTIYDNTARSCNNYYADSSSGGFCFLR